MKWHLRLLPIFSIAFLLAAPLAGAKPAKKDEQPDKSGDASNYYPLQVGNTWEYRVDVAGTPGKAVSRITKIESIDNVPMAVLQATVNNNVVATEYLAAKKEGVFRYRNGTAKGSQEITPPICLLKYPARSGDKWESEITVDKEKGKYYCETKEETVKVPAGDFKAMKVTITLESKGQKVNTSYWFVNNVGFVKQTVEAGDLAIEMQLEKYELGKDAQK